MASKSITKLARAAESGRRAAIRVREKAKAQQAHLVTQGEVLGGGAAGGLIDASFGDGAEAEVMGLPLVMTAGALLTLAGFADFKGSEHFGSTGAGMLAYALGNFTRDQFSG